MENASQLVEVNSAGVEDDVQPAVIAFLSDPQNYPQPAGSVSSISSHAAIVFLSGSKAYKLKRAVKLPYLDFSTVEQRRAVLVREGEINTEAAPGLYLSVIPITHAPGRPGFEFGGKGPVADWVLVMRRFGQEALLELDGEQRAAGTRTNHGSRANDRALPSPGATSHACGIRPAH